MSYRKKRICFAVFITVCSVLGINCGKSVEQQKKETEKILYMDTFRSLLKIESATEVGVNYQKYGELLIDAKTFVNEANLILSDETIKKMFNTVIEEYADAIKIWKEKIDSSWSLDVAEGQWNSIIKKYSIPTEKRSYGTYANADLGMQLIWAKATTDLQSIWPIIQSLDSKK